VLAEFKPRQQPTPRAIVEEASNPQCWFTVGGVNFMVSKAFLHRLPAYLAKTVRRGEEDVLPRPHIFQEP
jgi:hypothetical protein